MSKRVAQEYKILPIGELKLYPTNARRGNVEVIQESIEENGWFGAAIVQKSTGYILKGNHSYKAALAAGHTELPVLVADVDDVLARKILLADNRASDGATYDNELLAQLLTAAQEAEGGLRGTGFDDTALSDLLKAMADDDGGAGDGGADDGPTGPTLADRFLVPPFTVLDARQGYWQERKREWSAMGIESEEGRRGDLTFLQGPPRTDIVSKRIQSSGGGTSIFDPVLCELIYRWFSPPGGLVLDPFAGGSVRGITAAKLGRRYVGVELRGEQVLANRAQAAKICGRSAVTEELVGITGDLTPVVQVGDIMVKRDDLFAVGGVRGGKVRTCYALAVGAAGLVTAGSRASPQVNIVAHIARALGIPCRVHTPEGTLSHEVTAAQLVGAEVVQHKAGYNSVIVARAHEDAQAAGWVEIPFGMECDEAVKQTRRQVANIPRDTKRIVMPVGSGMSLAGVLHGLVDAGLSVPVMGIVVGADPTKRLEKYAPANWREMVKLVPSGADYHAAAKRTRVGDLELDAVYEAKCIPFLQAGDLLWVVGIRATAVPLRETGIVPTWIEGDSRNIPKLLRDEPDADLVFSCPPYADLEVYSDDPRDISTLGYAEFVPAYREIIGRAVAKLKADRFACFVVGEVRAKDGGYLNFVGDTIAAFEAAGARYYNEAILVTAIGSLPLRAGRTFSASRKLGKTHQNMLVFVKGDPKRATEACGPVEVADTVPDDDGAPAEES